LDKVEDPEGRSDSITERNTDVSRVRGRRKYSQEKSEKSQVRLYLINK